MSFENKRKIWQSCIKNFLTYKSMMAFIFFFLIDCDSYEHARDHFLYYLIIFTQDLTTCFQVKSFFNVKKDLSKDCKITGLINSM